MTYISCLSVSANFKHQVGGFNPKNINWDGHQMSSVELKDRQAKPYSTIFYILVLTTKLCQFTNKLCQLTSGTVSVLWTSPSLAPSCWWSICQAFLMARPHGFIVNHIFFGVNPPFFDGKSPFVTAKPQLFRVNLPFLRSSVRPPCFTSWSAKTIIFHGKQSIYLGNTTISIHFLFFSPWKIRQVPALLLGVPGSFHAMTPPSSSGSRSKSVKRKELMLELKSTTRTSQKCWLSPGFNHGKMPGETPLKPIVYMCISHGFYHGKWMNMKVYVWVWPWKNGCFAMFYFEV